jgi:hypothetical protein
MLHKKKSILIRVTGLPGRGKTFFSKKLRSIFNLPYILLKTKRELISSGVIDGCHAFEIKADISIILSLNQHDDNRWKEFFFTKIKSPIILFFHNKKTKKNSQKFFSFLQKKYLKSK